MTDPGVADKRLLLDEREFYSALAVMQREGNIVSRVVRDAWDCRPVLRTLTKNTQTRVANAFISIVGHITTDELQQTLDHTSDGKRLCQPLSVRLRSPQQGAAARRRRCGADRLIGAKVQAVIEAARAVERVTMTDERQAAVVRRSTPALSAGQPGLLGAITARAEAQTHPAGADLRAARRCRRDRSRPHSRPRSPCGRTARPPRATSSAICSATRLPTPSCARCAGGRRAA